MFEKTDYQFVGKHGEIMKKLTLELDERTKLTIFKRNIDVLFIAPIVGYLWNRRAERDTHSQVDSDETKKINFQQLNTFKDIIKHNYQLIMLLHDKDKIDVKERLNRAFRYGSKDPERVECDKIYESYILGGLEVLNEKILKDAVVVDDYMLNLYNFIDEYHERKEVSSMSTDEILKMFM